MAATDPGAAGSSTPPRPSSVQVDALGLLCPLPVLRCEQVLRRAPTGALVVLLADDAGILLDLPAWCAGTGHELVAIEPLAPRRPGAPAGYRCTVRSGTGAA